MELIKTDISGLVIIKPRVFEDDRGYFYESFKQEWFDEHVGTTNFVQDNQSLSGKGILRGLHFQKEPFAQGKLVRVIKGAVLDVAVDIRVGSPTYGKHRSIELSERNHLQFYVPSGFAHGFLTLEEQTIFSYKCTNIYNKESEGGLIYNDESLGIDWGITNPKLSNKDKDYLAFKDFKSPFKY